MTIAHRRWQCFAIHHPPLPGVAEALRGAGDGVAADQLKRLFRVGSRRVAVQPDHILELGAPDLPQYTAGERAGVHSFRQFADTAVLPEPVALAQHGHGLVEWLA